MAKLNDKQKKQIIAQRIEGETLQSLANRFGVSKTTVYRALQGDLETKQKVTQKKAQNTTDILSHMEKQKDQVCSLLDSYLSAMQDSSKIKRAGVLQLATAMGIIIDKYTVTAQNEQALKKLDELMDKVGGVI